MRKLLIVTALLVASLASAQTADYKDVARVVGMIANKKVPVVSRQGSQIVFVHKGMRYTFWNSGERIKADDPNSAWISVWVRKDGTSGQGTMNTFSDHGFDGNVDFGIDGKKVKYFSTGTDSISKPEGLEHRAFWQKQYDAAIDAAVQYMQRRSK